MRIITKFLFLVIISGFWGLIIYLFFELVLSKHPFLASALLFPFLFGGISVTTGLIFKRGVPLFRTLTVGIIAGTIYQALSPLVPYVAAVLSGATLGVGAIDRHHHRYRDLFKAITPLFKGVLVFPVFVFSGSVLADLTSLFLDSPWLIWFFWAVWLHIGIGLIISPMPLRFHARKRASIESESELFDMETRRILRGLKDIDSSFDLETNLKRGLT